jgi:hypothetical protein
MYKSGIDKVLFFRNPVAHYLKDIPCNSSMLTLAGPSAYTEDSCIERQLSPLSHVAIAENNYESYKKIKRNTKQYSEVKVYHNTLLDVSRLTPVKWDVILADYCCLPSYKLEEELKELASKVKTKGYLVVTVQYPKRKCDKKYVNHNKHYGKGSFEIGVKIRWKLLLKGFTLVKSWKYRDGLDSELKSNMLVFIFQRS